MSVTITKENYQSVVSENATVLLDFWATWCVPCKMIAPVIEEIAAERPDVLVGKVNVDDDMELAMQFGITGIPTLVIIKNGVPAAKIVGVRPKAEILKLLDA